MATYDPVSTATALAESYVYGRQVQLDTNSANAQSKLTAINSLKSSLNTFTTALNNLSNKGGVVQQTTSVTGTGATASASSTAAAGSYSFQVKSLATAQQSLYSLSKLNLKSDTQASGGAQGTGNNAGDNTNVVKKLPEQPRFVVSIGDDGTFVSVDLDSADEDNNGELSVTEVARAINAATAGKVSAAVMTVGNEQKLLLTGGDTGKQASFALHTFARGTDDAAIKDVLKASAVAPAATESDEGDENTTPAAPVPASLIVADEVFAQAQNAIVRVGGENGIDVESANNTYTGIAGLTVNFTAKSSEPITVKVSKDESSTVSNMQSFVSAYNTLVQAIDKLTASGNAEAGTAAGAFSGDAGVRSLRSQLNTLLRSTIDGESLTSYGITAKRDGTIELDTERFNKKVAANPEAIDALLGKTSTLEYQRTGVFGKLQTYVNSWTASTGGLLQSRQDNLQKMQKQYTKDQATIDRLYEQAYQRYLQQFTTLASLEDQMGSTSTMLASMFTTSSSSK